MPAARRLMTGMTASTSACGALPISSAGVPVLAAAPGVVRGTRDGETDRLVRSDIERAAVKDRECGNGVVIDHGGGVRDAVLPYAAGLDRREDR